MEAVVACASACCKMIFWRMACSGAGTFPAQLLVRLLTADCWLRTATFAPCLQAELAQQQEQLGELGELHRRVSRGLKEEVLGGGILEQEEGVGAS